MPQIFHRSMNTFSRMSIFGAVFIVAGGVFLAGILARSPYATEAGVVQVQPVAFSHKHHVGKIGIDCRFCHWTVETAASAGMPSTEICLNCHSQLFRDSPMLDPVRESARTGRPLAWNRVHDLPDFVYFDHSIHLHKGLACESCHGRVDEMPLMWREETLHMEWCLDCHRQPERRLRARAALFQFAQQEAGEERESGERLLEEYHVSRKTNCSHCHR